jgi:alkanesulfonate monooxygenase SsuD/methylene tetrahydromethanopterin reductase-like flavin-dependent oxidoreductase (luciferase family)
VKFQVLDIIPHLKNPLTGEIVSTADRVNQVVATARRAEELGFDSFSVGERHAGEFISSSPTTVLAGIAAVTDRIRLQSGVTVLAVLDPVRVAEDYATIDQLSRGRLELVIGKGNEVLQYPLFGLDLADQWDLLAENYGLLRRLWREEDVTWSGRFRAPLTEPTASTPRPFAGPPRIWHGSATTLTSAALAARWGDPLFTANAIQPRENYHVLVQHYREEYERHGHDPKQQYLGSGSGAGGVFIADTTQEAIRQFGPVYEALTANRNVPGNNSPFRDIQHAVAEGPGPGGQPGTGDRQDPRLPLALRPRPAVHLAAHNAALRTAAGHPGTVRAGDNPRRPGRRPHHLVGDRSPLRQPPGIRHPQRQQEHPCLRTLKHCPSLPPGTSGTPPTNGTVPTRTVSWPSLICTGWVPSPPRWRVRREPGV